MDVSVTPLLPIPPSPAEDAVRIVRHRLVDVLAWLGEDVGPRPGEPTHAFFAADMGSNGVMFVSDEYAAKLREAQS